MPLHAADVPKAGINTVCPISGKPANPKITYAYEGVTYAFASDTAREQFKKVRAESLYQQLGGKAAIDAAVESFYVKFLADKRVNHFFEDISMNRQRKKQKEFLSAALGGPISWTGKNLRKAHENVSGLNETHFNAIAGHLKSTLEDLKVKPELIKQVLAIVETTRNDVLNRPKKSE